MTTIDLPRGFELSAVVDFYRGFTPGSGMALASENHSGLTFSFLIERTWQPVAVAVSQRGRQLDVSTSGGDEAAAVAQVKRMLGLDADAAAWQQLGERDEMVGRLQAMFPGFFTAAFPSPYEAALGGVLSQRSSIDQASALRRRLMELHGEQLTLDGPLLRTLPTPETLLSVKAVPGIPSVKLDRMHGLARAALDGWLDAERLRAMGPDAALAMLQSLPGIGPWTAEHAFARGAAPFDYLPTAEPRALRGTAVAYGIEQLTPRKYGELSEHWKPFRMWVAVLLSRQLGRLGQWGHIAQDARGKRWALKEAVAR